MSYTRYGWLEENNNSGGGSGLTSGQEAILNNLGSIQTGNALQKLVTLDPTGDLYSIDPVREWTSDVTRHMAVDAHSNRYLPFGYPNGLRLDLTGDIYSVTNNNDSLAILPYACKANTNIQFELMFGSITSSNQSSLHFGIIDPSLLSTETIGDINNWVLDPDLYKNEGMLMTLEYHSNQVKYLYDGGAYTTVTPIDYRGASFGDLLKGTRVLVGLRANGVEVVYVDENNVTQARHRISQTIGNIENKYFFIALGNSTMRFRICTSTESITYTGVSTPMSNFVDKTHRNDTLLPTSYKQGAGTVITPINLVDSFSVWTNNNITPGNKNGVYGTNTYTVSSGLWNSMAVVPFQMSNGKYMEFKHIAGTNANHGTAIGFISRIAFEGIPDASQWAVTQIGLTTGGALGFFDGSPSFRVDGSAASASVHTSAQRNIQPGDVLQFGVKDNVIEMTVYDDTTKAIIYNISYANVGNFNFAGSIYPAILTNHTITYSHRLSPDIYRGTQLTGTTYVTSTISPSTYAQYNVEQRGKLMYDAQHNRPLTVSNGSIVNITTVKEVNTLPVFIKAEHLGSMCLFNGRLYIGGHANWILVE